VAGVVDRIARSRQSFNLLGESHLGEPQLLSQAEIHEMASSKWVEDRIRAANALGPTFVHLIDKASGWEDLHRLTLDNDYIVRLRVANALGLAFSHLPDKTIGWQDLHNLVFDDDYVVRRGAAHALGLAFANLPDRIDGWKDLISLVSDKISDVRLSAEQNLRSAFAILPDKMKGWQDLYKLAQNQERDVRLIAANCLYSIFALLPDKEQGWQDLQRLAQDQDRDIRRVAARALGSSFAILPDKEQGWQDLSRLSQDQERDVRLVAATSLCSSFALLSNKELGWQDLHRLVQNQDREIREVAARALGSSFAILPDKEQGWQDLYKLAQDRDSNLRWVAKSTLISSFALLPDKKMGWQDISSLAHNQKREVRLVAANVLGSIFPLLLDKDLGWQDLDRLVHDDYSDVRRGAAGALGLSFAHLPDREQGWKVLIRLARDKDSEVRGSAAGAFGSSFALLPDKEAGWKVLIGLAQDQVSGVRMNAYHSLGRASIYRASEASEKNVIRAELEAAVEYFERSSKEKSYFNPARFCLPFYRSYLALTFQGASESEVQRYLAEAKEAVGSSENRRELFGAVENLAKALEETQDLKKKSKEQIQGDLKAYRWYCDRAAEHMAAAEEKTPGAVRLLRKCNPIIEERIETIIAGIQKTAREICQVTRDSGTKYEAPGARINQEAKSLSSEDPIKAFKGSTRIASILREFCSLLPKGKRGHACEIVDEIESEQDLPSRLSKIELALTYLQPNISLEAYELATAQKLDLIDKKLDTVIHDLAKIKIGTGNIFANLCAVRSGLAAIAESGKKAENPENASGHQYTPDANQIKMGDLIDAKVLELEEILKTKATKEDNQAILNKLESLKPSVGWEWLGRLADLIAVFDASIKVLQFLA